jgi:hypothetical protein
VHGDDFDRHVIHNLCVLPENRQWNSQELHAAVVQVGSPELSLPARSPDSLTRTVEALTTETGTAVHAHALEAWRHAQSPVEN